MRRFYTIIEEKPTRRGAWLFGLTHVGEFLTEREIISNAHEVCADRGITLWEVAGIPWAASGEGSKRVAVPARAFNEGEEFESALTVLNSNVLSYQIYDSAKPEEVEKFIQRASAMGLGDTALHLVESTRHVS